MYFISKDHFYQYFVGMASKKGFCCKEQLDLAVHRLQAGGFLQKFVRDSHFKIAFKILSTETVSENQWRCLTLSDLSAAFVFLISGYCISFLTLIIEIFIHRKKRVVYPKTKSNDPKHFKRLKCFQLSYFKKN